MPTPFQACAPFTLPWAPMPGAQVHHALFRRLPQDHRKSTVNGIAKVQYSCMFSDLAGQAVSCNLSLLLSVSLT